MKYINMLLVLIFVLCACQAQATPTAAPTQPPPPTNTPVPTEAPTATPEPTATATNEPSPTPDPILFRDDFEGALADGWEWTRENPKYWNLTENPGWLQIMNRGGYVSKNSQENILLRLAPEGNFEIITKLKFQPDHNFQFAGLIMLLDNKNYLQFGRAYCGYSPPCVDDGFYIDYYEEGKTNGDNFATVAPDTDTIYLRLSKRATRFNAYYSENGADWLPIGEKNIQFKPISVGLVSGQGSSSKIPSDFDYFIIKQLP
jgi:beta-xylosidase